MQIYKYVTIQAIIPIACDNAAIDYDNAHVLYDLAFNAICEDARYVARTLSIVSHETVVNDSNHMTHIWEWAAELLTHHVSETMDLHEVRSLSVEVATILARSKGEQLILSGLTHVDDNVAAVLSSYKGLLVLSGIKTLSDKAAEALGNRVLLGSSWVKP
jgi:hypothetical protein